jgi:AcrR family transcriptional regulator
MPGRAGPGCPERDVRAAARPEVAGVHAGRGPGRVTGGGRGHSRARCRDSSRKWEAWEHVSNNDVSTHVEGRSVREAILAAAVELFSRYGYHAAPLRDIARIAGIQAASIYYHYTNKQALLVEIMETYMQRLNSNLERILREYSDPLERLRAAIANHIRLHTTFKAEFFIIDTEIRALEGSSRDYIISLRDRYEELVQEILRDGMERGFFRHSDIKVTSYALIAMCTEVAAWFRPGGRLTVQQVIDLYSGLIMRGLLQGGDHQQTREAAEHISPPVSDAGAEGP